MTFAYEMFKWPAEVTPRQCWDAEHVEAECWMLTQQ
jgi:hypothetical protein